MEIVRRYICETIDRVARYYASVQLEDGTTVEVGSAEPLSDDEAMALAAQSVPAAPEPVLAVEAEDGTIV